MAAGDAPVWKALANPVRRRMLDLLRARPRTTGELAAAFPSLTRFAAMQHLGVLARARLVLVRREGRQRVNPPSPPPRPPAQPPAASPPLTRFAAMQHRGVLGGARLVLVRREGRQRFNPLTPAPLRQVHERWFSRYADAPAAAALALKRHAEQPAE